MARLKIYLGTFKDPRSGAVTELVVFDPKGLELEAGKEPLDVEVEFGPDTSWTRATLKQFRDAGKREVHVEPASASVEASNPAPAKFHFSVPRPTAHTYFSYDLELEHASGGSVLFDPVIIIKPW